MARSAAFSPMVHSIHPPAGPSSEAIARAQSTFTRAASGGYSHSGGHSGGSRSGGHHR